jgi:hypothetical protein
MVSDHVAVTPDVAGLYPAPSSTRLRAAHPNPVNRCASGRSESTGRPGSLDQVRRDLETLEAMGAEWLVLDTYHGRPEDLANPEITRRGVEVLLEKAIDLRGLRLVS